MDVQSHRKTPQHGNRQRRSQSSENFPTNFEISRGRMNNQLTFGICMDFDNYFRFWRIISDEALETKRTTAVASLYQEERTT
ncbi:hypothetical protein L484_022041 [Morus notabilis]|uniref:Uncharacterized protein n=1 Tax=Morus notabilis TaxID=981085 RepID=W9RP75_9ROSA|nr:hypothetical protein L484_022041 [Morus notabilis]